MAFENCDVAAACASVTSLLPHSFQNLVFYEVYSSA